MLSTRAKSLIAVMLVVVGAAATAAYALGRFSQRAALAGSLTGGDPARAADHIVRYGCGGCHLVPGVSGAGGLVGPPLSNMSERLYVGGMLPNTPENLIAWIEDPRAINPRTAMPATGIPEQAARDIAAYLYAR